MESITLEKLAKLLGGTPLGSFDLKLLNLQDSKVCDEHSICYLKDQKFIEYSLVGADYLNKVAGIVKKNDGGLLMIDYGYMEKRMKNTLKSISNHKPVSYTHLTLPTKRIV